MPISVKTDLLALIARDVTLKWMASTHGGEYAGPCPWCGGEDRFRVWPEEGRYWCRQCGRSGDAIQYLRDKRGLSYVEACQELSREPHVTLDRRQGGEARRRPSLHAKAPEPESPDHLLQPPGSDWQAQGWAFVFDSVANLHTEIGGKAAYWLHQRGLTLETITNAGLGYNPADRWEEREQWGLVSEVDDQGRRKRIWLPRGIVIPWTSRGQLWRVNIRRPVGEPKYIGPAGSSNGLYNVDALKPSLPVVLVEGEIDALTIQQHAGDLAAPVATGSTSGSRQIRWIARLATAPLVLIAFDSDDAGEKAASYWQDVLPNSKRWRPIWEDANQMAQDGADLRAWVAAGL